MYAQDDADKYQYLGNYESHSMHNNAIVVNTSIASIQLQAFLPNVIHVQLSDSTKKFATSASMAVVQKALPVLTSTSETDSTLEYQMGQCIVHIRKSPMQLTIKNASGKVLSRNWQFFTQQSSTVQGFDVQLSKQEALYGGGSRATSMNRRGQYLQLYNNAHYGYTYGADHLNISIPLFLSTEGYALFIDNPSKASIDCGKSADNVLKYVANDGVLSCYYIIANTNDELLETYTQLTGRQPLPPRWALGYIQSRYGYENEADTYTMLRAMQKAKFPIDAIVLDLYWFGDKEQMGTLDWDKKRFPAPSKMISDFKRKNIETILITEPYFTTQSKHFNTLAEKGFFTTNAAKKPYVLDDFWASPAALLDLYKPAAQDWFWQQYEPRIKEGIGGWWCDLGEPEKHPADMQHLGGSAENMHNQYSLVWAELLFKKYAQHYPRQRLFNLIRSGYAGMQRYSTFTWSGDIARSWDGLKAQSSIMLSMGLNGLAYMHSDAGGFTGGTQNEELYIRWMQMAIYSPVLRPHGHGIPTEPIHYSPEAQSILRKNLRKRYALLPYNYTLAFDNHRKGSPLARPMNYYAFGDSTLNNIDDQYYWGDDLIIAPIYTPNKATKRVYLPSGNWLRLDEAGKMETITGKGWHTVTVDINDIPTFFKAGNFLITANIKPKQYVNTTDISSDSLSIIYHIGQPKKGDEHYSYMYWDDGKTPDAYAKGQYELIELTGKVTKKAINIQLDYTNPKPYKGKCQQRHLQLLIPNIKKKPKQLLINGQKLAPYNSPSDLLSKEKGWLVYDGRLIVQFNWNNEPTNIQIKGKKMR